MLCLIQKSIFKREKLHLKVNDNVTLNPCNKKLKALLMLFMLVPKMWKEQYFLYLDYKVWTARDWCDNDGLFAHHFLI